MTTGVVLIILLAYGAAMLWIGRLARTHAGSFQDAIAAPRQTTLLMLAGAVLILMGVMIAEGTFPRRNQPQPANTP